MLSFFSANEGTGHFKVFYFYFSFALQEDLIRHKFKINNHVETVFDNNKNCFRNKTEIFPSPYLFPQKKKQSRT